MRGIGLAVRYLIKPIVIALLALLCAVFIRGYGAYMKRRALESRDILHLLESLRKGMSVSLSTPREAFSTATVSAPSVERFSALVCSGEPLYEAFCSASHAMSISRACREMLLEYFSSFGKGYLQDEIRCADELTERYTSLIENEERCGANDFRVVKSIAVAVTLGVIILII